MLDSLHDYSIITNIPYGRQSKAVGKISEASLARSYQGFGAFLRRMVQEKKVRDVFVVAPKTRVASPYSF